MHSTALTTILSLSAILASIPTITATPTPPLKRDSPPPPPTFNDGYGDIPTTQFSMIISADNELWAGVVPDFNIYTAAGKTNPKNFDGTSQKWQTFDSEYLKWTVDMLIGDDYVTLNYAGQHFVVTEDPRCTIFDKSSFGQDTTYQRCICDLVPPPPN